MQACMVEAESSKKLASTTPARICEKWPPNMRPPTGSYPSAAGEALHERIERAQLADHDRADAELFALTDELRLE